MSFVLGDNRYSVVYLDRPDVSNPAEYNERVYGRFGSYFKYDIDEGKPKLPWRHFPLWRAGLLDHVGRKSRNE